MSAPERPIAIAKVTKTKMVFPTRMEIIILFVSWFPTGNMSYTIFFINSKFILWFELRDRFEELQQFVPQLTTFLKKQFIKHHIFIINQVNKL